MTLIYLSHCSLMASIALILIYHDDSFVINTIHRRAAVESSCSYSCYNNKYKDSCSSSSSSSSSSNTYSRSSSGSSSSSALKRRRSVGGVMTMNVAPFKRPRAQNVPGNLYVDESCIDCDACRWICPSVFNRSVSLSLSILFSLPLSLFIYIYTGISIIITY